MYCIQLDLRLSRVNDMSPAPCILYIYDLECKGWSVPHQFSTDGLSSVSKLQAVLG